MTCLELIPTRHQTKYMFVFRIPINTPDPLLFMLSHVVCNAHIHMHNYVSHGEVCITTQLKY